MELERSEYTKEGLKGLGRGSRTQLTAVLRKVTGTVTPSLAADALSIPGADAAKLLARWASQGWLHRLRRGSYVPVPLESETADVMPEDAWVVADAAFSPCFICGWTAAEHWGLTEQVFRTVLVATSRRPRNRQPVLGGIDFRVRTAGKEAFFGLKNVWRGRVRVQVTDPSRTIIDLMADPTLGGGLRSSTDMLRNYLDAREHRNIELLMEYAQTFGVGAVFKRLGFLLEQYAPQENEAIAACRAALTQGNACLDPALPSRTLATAWRLWLPDGWSAR
jgi:predicted transcriptional regulator of viral defense system